MWKWCQSREGNPLIFTSFIAVLKQGQLNSDQKSELMQLYCDECCVPLRPLFVPLDGLV